MAVKNIDNYTSADGFGLPVNIRRGNPNPLDNTEVWPDIQSAIEYAKNDPTAYVGQVISYFSKDTSGNDIVKLVQIKDVSGTLEPISGDSSITIQEMPEKTIDDIIFAVFGGK